MRLLFLAAILAVSPGCDCAAGSGAACATPCGDGAMCPAGFTCSEVGCCSCTASAETCDGLDSDCDLIADDGLETTCACAPGGPGPGAESCNGIDDDCNGMIDDGLPPADEVCDATDQDCDGMIDETLPPLECPCAPGGIGRGTETCNGADDDCNGMIDDGLMGPEVCNGIDDDCNGMIDEGLMGGPEVCNGIDDDCDGMTDEDTVACACAPGGPGMSMEICNAIDDDCDGMVDDGVSPCGGFGDPCAGNDECTTRLCVGDAFEHYCSRDCAMPGVDPGDCPAGYRCFDNPATPPAVDHCRRDYTDCARDADCAPGEVCAALCDDAGATAITECRPAIAGGADAPGACTVDNDCASNDCFRTSICTEVCATNADCSAGYRCVLVPFPGCGGGDYVPRCLDACDCDSECPAGQLCQPYVTAPPAGRVTVGACDISYGTLPPGADCDNTADPPMFCERAICSRGGTGFCTQVCTTACGCPAGIGPCRASTVTFPDLGPFPAMTCDTM